VLLRARGRKESLLSELQEPSGRLQTYSSKHLLCQPRLSRIKLQRTQLPKLTARTKIKALLIVCGEETIFIITATGEQYLSAGL
jgi:hypothetical protein